MKQALSGADMQGFPPLMEEDYVSVPPGHQRRIDAVLTRQLPWLDSAPEWRVFNGHFLSVTDHRRPELPERVINLAYLNPTPRWRPGDLQRRLYLVAAMAVAAALVLFIYPDAALAMLLLLVSVVAWLALSIRPGSWEFRTAIGDIPVCRISEALFRRAETGAFVSLISERAEGARVVLPSGSRRVAAEIAEHRRMLTAGIVSQRHYKVARQRLLARMQQGGPNRPSQAQLA